ncbi:MAG: DUF1493 family protein [Tunicatimonas sp.]
MLEKVICFTVSKLGTPNSDITKNSKIESDFGISGLDTISFYEEFFKEFGVKNSEAFKWDRHVSSENLELELLVKSIFSKQAREKLKTKDVSIKHLTKVAETKIWVDE